MHDSLSNIPLQPVDIPEPRRSVEKRYRRINAETGAVLQTSHWYADDEFNGMAFVESTAREFATESKYSNAPFKQRMIVDTRTIVITSEEIPRFNGDQ